ncbi:MAG: 50S ribosomal protein L17 [Bradymonadia bacterium]
MRHRKSGRKLGRNASHRDAMFRNMVTSLFESEKIQTTDAKAKELRRVAERLITLGKRNAPSLVEAAAETDRDRLTANRVAAVRQAARLVRSREVLQKLFSDLAERYQARPGGYTRMMRIGRRLGDGAEMVIIELMPDGLAEPAAPVAPVADATQTA